MNETVKRREDSVFGLHFDFHANTNSRDVGIHTDPEKMERMLRYVKPDYVQVDTKGHPGYSSYPTKAGVTADLAEGVDRLRVWRDVTRRCGVALYAHHSSLWDAAAAAQHPEWAVTNENGRKSDAWMSMFGPYLTERLIPQLLELAVDYELDGVWMDGDVWGVVPDYGPGAQAAYRAKYGRSIPKSDDEDFPRYIEFLADTFKKYLKTYTEAVKEKAPAFQVCSNHLMNQFDEAGEESPVNHISFDLAHFELLRLETRIAAKAGKPWDAMSWFGRFLKPFDAMNMDKLPQTDKEIPQLMQEAAVSLSLGGGFEFCHGISDRTSSRAAGRYKALSEFCNARKKYCFKAEPIHQVGIFFSAGARLDSEVSAARAGKMQPFDPLLQENLKQMNSALNAALSAGFSAEVIYPNEDLSVCGMIVVPNYAVMTEDEKKKITDYAKAGGRVMLIGPDAAAHFAKEMNIEVKKMPAASVYPEKDGELIGWCADYCEVKGEGKVLADMYTDEFGEKEPIPAVFESSVGEGKIRAVAFSLLSDEVKTSKGVRLSMPAGLRTFTAGVMKDLWPDPAVRVSGSSFVDVVLMKKDGMTCVNLINMLCGSPIYAFREMPVSMDEIPPLSDLRVELKYPTAPRAVTLEPEHRPLSFTYEDGRVKFALDRLYIHSVITVK